MIAYRIILNKFCIIWWKFGLDTLFISNRRSERPVTHETAYFSNTCQNYLRYKIEVNFLETVESQYPLLFVTLYWQKNDFPPDFSIWNSNAPEFLL